MKRVRLSEQSCFLGIDPGLSGALAFYVSREQLLILDIPTFDAQRGRQVDVYKAVREIREAAKTYGPEHAFIEKVAAMPKQGVSSMFKFGTTYGIIQGIVASLDIPMTFISPQRWKKALQVPKIKDGARHRASQLMPNNADTWSRKKDHGRAEAALIAYYGATQMKAGSL